MSFVSIQKANAQEHSDTLDASILSSSRYFYYKPFEIRINDVRHLNYDIDHCSQPDAVLAFNRNYYARMENIGHPHLNLYFRPWYADIFSYQPNTFQAYLYTPENIRFYQLQKPYTELQYYSSLAGEHFFNVTHSQNVAPNWNVSFEDRFVNANGSYEYSSTKSNYLNVNSHFFSKDGRYRLKAAFIYNYSHIRENGGIMYDSLFTENIQTTRDAIPVNLTEASTKWKEINIFANQSYSLHKQDTNRPNQGSVFNLGAVGYNIQFQRESRIYRDGSSDLSYYAHSYFDTIQTYDSIGNWKIKNTFFWTNDVYEDHQFLNPVKLTFGIRHQYIRLRDVQESTDLMILSPLAKMRIAFGGFSADFSTVYSLGDYYNKHDYAASGKISYQKKSHEFSFMTNLKLQDPEYFYSSYHSNHFIWENPSFDKERILNAAVEYSWDKRITLGTAWYQYQNAVFFNANIEPFQHRSIENLCQIYLEQKLRWKFLSFDGFGVLQFSSNDKVFRLPVLELKETLAANFYLFKKSIFIQTGFDVMYNTAYYGDAYSPALASFYRQNDIKTGNHIWLDFFISGRVKRAFIFAKFTHINALFDKHPNYFMIPHYPTQDFQFKFGIIWKFFS